MILLTIAAAVVAAQPAKLHTYKDWIVGCDNGHVCQAHAMAPEAGGEDYLAMTIDRGGRSGDGAVLWAPLPYGIATGDRISLKVDGATAITLTVRSEDSISLPLTGGLLAALRNGGHASLFDAGGKKLGEASLAGLAATLRYIDDQQGRVGSVGALIATGAKPDAAIPAPPPYPVIVTPAPSSKPPRTVSIAVATRLIGPDNATCDDTDDKVKPQAYRLDATHSLVLIAYPCSNRPHNYFTGVYVLDETGPARPARFDVPPGLDERLANGAGDLTNGGWDSKTRQLVSYERGLGGCTSESYVWDGSRFRLVEQDETDECRGSVYFIRTWTARASR
jgi:hypothetical protein